AGVRSPQDIGSLGDLAALPFAVKDDLREHYPFGLLAVPRERVVRVHASSGSRGKPTIAGYTAADLETWTEVMARSLAMAGVRPGMVVHNANGYGLFTGGLGFHQGAERLGATVVPVSTGFTRRQAMLLRDLGAPALCATPSHAPPRAEGVGPAAGAPLPPGEEGELVFTTLTKEAMPLLRYRTGDVASLSLEACACGRTLARMGPVRGRRDDMLIVRGVNLYPSQVEHVLLGVDGVAPHYQLVLERPGTMDELTVQCEPAAGGVDRTELRARVEHALHERT